MRLLCFGDSFAAEGYLTQEIIADGKPPSWMDLLAEKLNCKLIVNGHKGTGPLELVHHLSTYNDFRPNDIVVCIFSRPSRLCLSPTSPGLCTHIRPHGLDNNELDYETIQQHYFKDKSIAQVKRLFQAQKWYELFIQNDYRSQAIQQTSLLALDSLAERNPTAKFFVKYSFSSEVINHNIINIQPKFFKYLDGACYSVCGELGREGERRTNHFVNGYVEPFVDYMYSHISKEINQ